MGGSSECSSGNATPREDVLSLPSTVTEGDVVDCPEPMIHPLSPSHMLPASPILMEEKTQIEGLLSDIPIMNNANYATSCESQKHGVCLTPSDLDRIKIFVHEFCVRSLIPYVERQIRYLNEAVTNRSRSKSILSATRRWLGGNKTPGTISNTVVYTPEATELQIRRLGDFCFMFGLYEFAFSAYHTAKNDFKNDQAWLFYAGAQEMAALSAFMMNSSDYPKRYLEESLHTYLNVCKVYNFAIRATLLSSEILKHSGEYSEAAMMMIKLTSEESDLLSALMLEQAAHCFINHKRPMPRKYAFHMTLAGHRFSKAGQRVHSFRSYEQAFQVYSGRKWVLAEDHIHFTMGKQAHHMKNLFDALKSYTYLIDQEHKMLASSKQSSSQQIAYIKEYLTVLMQLCSNEESKTVNHLPLPSIDSQATKVMIGTPLSPSIHPLWLLASHFSFDDDDVLQNKKWMALEQEIISTMTKGPLMVFKPALELLTPFTQNNNVPVVPIDEQVSFQISIFNPLSINLTMSHIELVYDFEPESDDANMTFIFHKEFPDLALLPNSGKNLVLSLFPTVLGKLTIKGISYKLCVTSDSTPSTLLVADGQQSFGVQGPRLNSNRAETSSVVYGVDHRLVLKVIPQMPKLKVLFKGIPKSMKSGQICDVDVEVSNVGPCPLKNMILAISDPKHAYFTADSMELPLKPLNILGENETKIFTLKSRAFKLPLTNGVLAPNESMKGKLWINAPHSSDLATYSLELLFYYQSTNNDLKTRYRTVRHSSCIDIEPSVTVSLESAVSESYSGKDISAITPHSLNINLSILNSKQNQNNFVSNILENNKSKDGDRGIVTIESISSNSESWTLVPHSLPKEVQIKSGEHSRLCIHCVQYKSDAEVHGEKSKRILFSHLPLGKDNTPPDCWWQFSLRQRIELRDLLAEPLPPNPGADIRPPKLNQFQEDCKHINKSFNLNLLITVLWKLKIGDVSFWGQHNILVNKLDVNYTSPTPTMVVKPSEGGIEDINPVQIIPVNPEPNIPSMLQPLNLKYLIKITSEMPQVIHHNFQKNRMCVINFKIVLHNCSGCQLNCDVSFSSSIPNMINDSSMRLFSPEASTQIMFIGSLTKKVSLGQWASKLLNLKALVTNVGTYCVGVVSVVTRRKFALPDEAVITQHHLLQSAVVVAEPKNVLVLS